MSCQEFDQLVNNLCRIDPVNSILNASIGSKTWLSSSNGNLDEWLEKLLPNTRLIIEPKIDGCGIALEYIGGYLVKAVSRTAIDKSQDIRTIKNVPLQVPIDQNIQIRGVLYDLNLSRTQSLALASTHLRKKVSTGEGLSFCSFQIINSDQNQFQALQELQRLGFETPETEFTNFTSEVDIYAQLWREGKLFKQYPTNGILLKVNSRKFQKQLGENNVYSNWCFAIKC